MKAVKILVAFLVAMALAAGTTMAMTAEEEQANKELELMTKDIAALCAQPGFRGFLRSEIAKSKNRENILVLDTFLDRAAKQKGMEKDVGNVAKKVQDAKIRHKGMKVNGLEGFDLYIPVEAHKAKWKGGKDFIVAFAPYGDDQNYKEIIGFTVWDGKRVVLDPKNAPETVVLAIVPEEHVSHEIPPGPKIREIEREFPVTEVKGKEVPHKPVPQEPGNSFIGIYRMYLRDDKEPWTRGAAEIYVMFGTVKGEFLGQGTACYEYDPADNIENFKKYNSLKNVNYSKIWYTVSNPPYDYDRYEPYCANYLKIGEYKDFSTLPCWYFDSNHRDKIILRIYEFDGVNVLNKMETVTKYIDGYVCQWHYWPGDDYVDWGSIYMSNFPFNQVYRHDMGNAIVSWYKSH